MQSHAQVATDHAARYMTQLAKHWSHRFEVRFDERQALIPLSLGPCQLTARDGVLDITLEAPDLASLARMEDVVAEHLDRFAFREGGLRYAWTRAQDAGHIDVAAVRVRSGG
jgi:hypothetical protein